VRAADVANLKRPESASIEIVCPHEVIECPPTSSPREEVVLAVTMGVRLVKVYGPRSPPPPNGSIR
jgi:hypothetical protein